MSIILEAARFAKAKHFGVFRKHSNQPYIVHPARVAGVISYLPNSTEEMVAAAWLHDVVEDCDVSHHEIFIKFGHYVSNLVAELTNPSKLYPNWPRRKRKALDLEHARAMHKEAKMIKMVDRIDNLLDYPLEIPEVKDFVRDLYLPESIKLYNAIKDADTWLGEQFGETLEKIKCQL